MQEDPRASQFRNKDLKVASKLTKLFALGTTTSEYAQVPSSNILPGGLEKLDSTEGLGDSEDLNISGKIGINLEYGTSP